jgi:hypothetical protein
MVLTVEFEAGGGVGVALVGGGVTTGEVAASVDTEERPVTV